MQTRSVTAWKANMHPDTGPKFKEGLLSVFRQWTALELAVHNQWGGPDSARNAEAMVNEIIDLFLNTHERIYKDDVSLILDDILESQFNVVCEDESTEEIGDILCRMFNQCYCGDFTLVTETLRKEHLRHEVVKKSQGLSATGDNMESDDEDDADQLNENQSEVMSASNAALNGTIFNMGNMDTDVEPKPTFVKPPPIIDEDGFETVVKHRKPKKK